MAEPVRKRNFIISHIILWDHWLSPLTPAKRACHLPLVIGEILLAEPESGACLLVRLRHTVRKPMSRIS